MKTEILAAYSTSAFAQALELLRAGEVIALPTDTVYGIAADGFNPTAIEKLYRVKVRPRVKAIPLLLASAEHLPLVAEEIPDSLHLLAAKFWPGALTFVLRARQNVPMILRGKGATVAVRVPDHVLVRDLARALGHPLAATSANLSGGHDPSTAGEVEAVLGGRIPLLLDGGATRGAIPSTVIDCTNYPPRILRHGAVAVAEIRQVLGNETLDAVRLTGDGC